MKGYAGKINISYYYCSFNYLFIRIFITFFLPISGGCNFTWKSFANDHMKCNPEKKKSDVISWLGICLCTVFYNTSVSADAGSELRTVAVYASTVGSAYRYRLLRWIFFGDTYSIKSVLSVPAHMFFYILCWLIKVNNKYKVSSYFYQNT